VVRWTFTVRDLHSLLLAGLPGAPKFPVFSQLAGNLAFPRRVRQLTPPSSGRTRAQLRRGQEHDFKAIGYVRIAARNTRVQESQQEMGGQRTRCPYLRVAHLAKGSRTACALTLSIYLIPPLQCLTPYFAGCHER
jgi:hypothetical protein